jgi:hypothetical protein
MTGFTRSLLAGVALFGFAGAAHATVYTSDGNIADLTAGISEYATLSNFSAGDVGSPFAPTSAELAANAFRVYDGGCLNNIGCNQILATFSQPVSAIRVFPNIDHFGAPYDGYQYTISGSNDLNSWTPLFDALTVAGAGEPFTLGSFTGTAPSGCLTDHWARC